MENAILVPRAPQLETLDWTGADRPYLGTCACQP